EGPPWARRARANGPYQARGGSVEATLATRCGGQTGAQAPTFEIDDHRQDHFIQRSTTEDFSHALARVRAGCVCARTRRAPQSGSPGGLLEKRRAFHALMCHSRMKSRPRKEKPCPSTH